MQVQPDILHICTWGFVFASGRIYGRFHVYTNNVGPVRYITYLHLRVFFVFPLIYYKFAPGCFFCIRPDIGPAGYITYQHLGAFCENAGPARYIVDFMYIPITNNIGPSGYIAYLHLGGLFINVGPAGYISLPAPWIEGLLGSICIPCPAAYIVCLEL